MAETSIAIDIATQVKSGLATAVGGVMQTDPRGAVSTVSVVAAGVRDSTISTREPLTRPCVAVVVGGGYPYQGGQGMTLREYSVTIEASTDFADDPWQRCMYDLEQAVTGWILTPATLTLTVSKTSFRRFSMQGMPRVVAGMEGGSVNSVTWECICGVVLTA